ncbi:hypothetical protein E2C01_019345 [Portunus trituberculatus]|uniref:Uncharacterized protein n=1 Tax=Portunus trituberculatus TaxID=210409 RepID=A0A5B7DWY6_PORTR|nr:hypothetical protein [Portunus trituberculatus]
MKVEDLYLQENYKEPLPTPLETIFESPQPSRNQRGDCPEVAPLMARRKLKRLCVFGSHYQPSRTKLRHRRDRAYRMKQLRGVRVPLGKAFSEDDVQMALSCLVEEEEEAEEQIVGLPRSPADSVMESVTQDLSFLQMDSEPSLASPGLTASQPSREQRRKRRSGLVTSPSSPLSAAPVDHPAQPPSARRKKLRQPSGLVFVDTSNILLAPEDAPGDRPPHPGPSKATGSQRKRQKTSSETEQGSRSARMLRTKSGMKRDPDASPASAKKKQCIPDPSLETPPAPPSQRCKTRGKSKGTRRVSGIHRPLYATNTTTAHTPNQSLTTDTPSPAITPTNTTSPAATPTNTTSRAATLTNIPSPVIIPSLTPSPAATLTNTPSPAIIATYTPSPAIISTHTPSPAMTTNTNSPNTDKEPLTAAPGASPTSPCTRMAALSLQCTSSLTTKPRKARRRSARLSLGVEGSEELRKMAHSGLGTLWLSKSPTMVSTVQSGDGGGGGGGDDDDDAVLSPPQPSVKRRKDSRRRRSNQFLPLPCVDAELSTTTTATATAITSTLPTVSITCRQANSTPPKAGPLPNSPFTHPLHNTPTQVTHNGIGEGRDRDGGSEGMGEMGGSTSSYVSEGSSLSLSPALSKSDIQNIAILEDLSDLTTPSLTNLTPSVKTPTSAALTPATPLTQSEELPPVPLTPPVGHISPPILTPILREQIVTPLTPSTDLSAPVLTPYKSQSLTPKHPIPAVTPSTENVHLTPNGDIAAPFTPSTTQATNTTACDTPARLTSTSVTPANITPLSITPAAHRDQHISPEEEWDSPIVSGIMTNETVIRLGRVYYGSQLSPSLSRPSVT